MKLLKFLSFKIITVPQSETYSEAYSMPRT